MGIKSFFQEMKTKVSPSRLFKALVTDSHNVVPKCMPNAIKSIEIVEGQGVTPGCIMKTNFPEGAPFKYAKHRIDSIDTEKYVCKYSLIEGDIVGDKIEKVCYEIKFEPSDDGAGCVIKHTTEFHTKGDHVELTDEEIKAGKDQAKELYKACEQYLIANPHVCA